MIDTIKKIFEKLFNIYPSEFRLVQSFFLYYTFVGIFYTVAVTTGDSLFLANIHHDQVETFLAWVYVGVAISSVITIWIYDLVSLYFSRKVLFIGIQLFLLITILFFRGFMLISPGLTNGWFYFSLVIWLEMSGLLSITLFFSFAGDFFTAHSAKRLYGYIAGGLSVGTIIGGGITGPMVATFGSNNLIVTCSALLGICILFSIYIFSFTRPVAPSDSLPIVKETEVATKYRSFIRYIFVSVLLGMFCYVIVDFQMKLTAKTYFPDTDQLASFFGKCYTITGLLQIPFQFIVVSFLLKRFGIINCLKILPVIHVVAACFFYSTGHGLFANHVLILIVTANFLRMMISETLEIPSRELLFLPLPSAVRIKAQTQMGGMMMPVGQGIAGLLVMVMTYVGWAKYQFSLAVVFFSITWICLLTFIVKDLYRKTLISSLKHFMLDESEIRSVINHSDMDPVFEDLLNNPKDHVIGFTLDFLWEREMSLGPFIEKIRELSSHHNETIAANALRLLGKTGDMDQLDVIQPLTTSPFIPVKRAAIIAVCSIKKEQALSHVQEWVKSDDAIIRQSAFLGCHKTCGPEADKIILVHIKKQFLESDPEACVSAIQACGEMQLVQFIPDMIFLYRNKKMRSQIAAALEKMPASCLPVIKKTMMDALMDDEGRSMMFHVASAIGQHSAFDSLWYVFLREPAIILRVCAGEALKRINNEDPATVLNANRFEIALNLICGRIDIINDAVKQIGDSDKITRELLIDHAKLEITCLFQLLVIRFTPRHMEKIRTSFFSIDPVQRSNAGELIDTLLPRTLNKRILPLLDPFIDQRIEKGTGLSKQTTATLIEMESWVRLLTIFHLKQTNSFLNRAEITDLKEREVRIYKNLDRIMILKQVPLFERVPGNYLVPLAVNANSVELKKGQPLFRQGDIGRSLYIICRGQIQIDINGVPVNTMGAMECIGEMSLLDAKPMQRSATCLAKQDCTLLKISTESFLSIIQTHTRASFSVLQTLAGRLRKRTSMKEINNA